MDQNLVIIGAPRSGTNMLRDVLTALPGVGTWPCDEINYIWRHGNVGYPSDALPRERATERVKRYIRGRFEAVRRSQNVAVVVEKTCANSLRVPFVDLVVPEAKYLFIYRDGIDATGSATLRWTAELDWSYLLEKARFVPLTDLPYYALRYLWSRIYRLFSREGRLAFWGPRLDNMDAILRRYSLEEVCAIQWQRCVEDADEALTALQAERVLRIRYEDFVARPRSELDRIVQWLGLEPSDDLLRQAVRGVSAKSVGKGRQALGDAQVARLQSLVGPTLQRFGYE